MPPDFLDSEDEFDVQCASIVPEVAADRSKEVMSSAVDTRDIEYPSDDGEILLGLISTGLLLGSTGMLYMHSAPYIRQRSQEGLFSSHYCKVLSKTTEQTRTLAMNVL